MREIVVPQKPPHTTSQGEAMQERERQHCITEKGSASLLPLNKIKDDKKNGQKTDR